ncbi:MAG: hypothetical protein C3F13_08900 [Anaerolineales bacterium]|nr:hypothetical protein [Anaerolineae bacterium]PWB53522.1 MAG: hypothetical protein C3F13_08900 [Anaerolineales bacterium]
MEIIINFYRPGKGITRYIDGLAQETQDFLKTRTEISQEFSQAWCEQVWWQNGSVPKGVLIGSVQKHLFFEEWFSVMELIDTQGKHLGYYVDIDTPLEKKDGEY